MECIRPNTPSKSLEDNDQEARPSTRDEHERQERSPNQHPINTGEDAPAKSKQTSNNALEGGDCFFLLISLL